MTILSPKEGAQTLGVGGKATLKATQLAPSTQFGPTDWAEPRLYYPPCPQGVLALACGTNESNRPGIFSKHLPRS